MAIKYPDIIEHNNPNFPLVDITSLKGVAYPLSSIDQSGSIPTAKRNPGIIVFDTTAQEFYGFKAADSSSVSWDNPSNWSVISTGGVSGGNITGSGTATQLAIFSGSAGQSSTEIFSLASLTWDNPTEQLSTVNISASNQFIGGSITSSRGILITSSGAFPTDNPFLIKFNDGNGQEEKFSVSSSGVVRFGALNNLPTPITGGLVFSASNFYVGT
tara:strand:+ start:235 stop:879 length:645 start_codon:yes stop_codon:yes gene_type:complete